MKDAIFFRLEKSKASGFRFSSEWRCNQFSVEPACLAAQSFLFLCISGGNGAMLLRLSLTYSSFCAIL